jgi:TPR repeat protein
MIEKKKTTPALFTIPQTTSWHFERTLKPDDKSFGKYTLIQPGAQDIAKVISAYAHHPVPAHNIASIEIIYSETLNRSFYLQMTKMNSRKGNLKFVPTWRSKTFGSEKANRETIYQKLPPLAQAYADPDVPHVLLLPLWHGTSDAVSSYIFESGYGIFTSMDDPTIVTDEGFFGKGVYAAHEAEYAYRSYAQQHGDKAVLLLNWVSIFEAYPVIHGDMDKLRGRMGGYDQCDAHFIPVRSDQHPNTNIYVPCKTNEAHQYTEVVVFNEAQCLPRYRIKLIQSVPKASLSDMAVNDYQLALDQLSLCRYNKVIEAFEEAKDSGHPAAAVRLHWLHSGASGVIPANPAKQQTYQTLSSMVFNTLKQKANFRGDNDAESQFIVGWCYQQGLGVERNLTKAAQYYWIAATQGHRDASYQLGVCCATGTGVKPDMQQAIIYYEKAASQEHIHAHYVLFQCYSLGLGVLPDPTKALLHKEAAQKGKHPQLASVIVPNPNPNPVPTPIVVHVPNSEDQKTIERLKTELKNKDEAIALGKQALQTREAELASKDTALKNKDIELENKEFELKNKNAEFQQQKQQLLIEKEQQLMAKESSLQQEQNKNTQLTEVLTQKETSFSKSMASVTSEMNQLKKDLQLSEKALQTAEKILQEKDKALQVEQDEKISLRLQLETYEKQKPVKAHSNWLNSNNSNTTSAEYKPVFGPPTSHTAIYTKPPKAFTPIFRPVASSSTAIHINPLKALTNAEQVEAMSENVAHEINADALKAIFKWVTEGHLVEIKKLLDKNPKLALATGAVTDRSDRTFKGITVLQYAAWALDIEMCNVIIPYIGQENKTMQLNALSEAPERYSSHEKQYDMTPLITKTQTYINNYNNWDDNKCREYWQKEVGGEQRKCPAWLIYAWSEEGKDVAWVTQSFSRGFKREYDKHRLDWWFTENYNSGRGVGSTWAVVRGMKSHVCYDRLRYTWWGPGWCGEDLKNHQGLKASRQEALESLKATSKNNSSMSVGKGPQ